uniref:MARVEL domain-containing protein n=1 Tax=Ditylenchus dipsaci TaxID=166011 RepID=A0A915E5E3_9BILA
MATDKQPSETVADPAGQSSSTSIDAPAPSLEKISPGVTTVSEVTVGEVMPSPGVPPTTHTKPPLRFDREFHNDPSNQLKFVQLATGAFAFVLTNNCYPNQYAGYCTNTLYSFFQLFNVVCVHGFFFIGTIILALCSLLSVPDAYYRYNFPLLEKFYTTLASAMYLLACAVVVINIFHVIPLNFSFIWLFQVGATIVAFLAYFCDFWRRWEKPEPHGVV